MRYLQNKRIIGAKPFIFLQLVPDTIEMPNPNPSFVSMYLWSHVDFLYKCDMGKHLEYREVTTEVLKRRLNHVKLAHLKIANAEKYSLSEVLQDNKKCDPMFSLCGVTLGMAITLLEAAPSVYNPANFAALSRKQFSVQLKRFNPEYFGFVGDKISKYTVHKYLMNTDKKWVSIIEDSREEILITMVYPSLIAAGTAFWLFSRRNKANPKKTPSVAKI